MDIIATGYALLLAHINIVSVVLGVAAAVLAGVFFTFSMFVMTALGNLAPAQGIRPMQQINVDVICWSFMSLFLGLPIAFLVIAVLALPHLAEPVAVKLLLAAFVYIAGVFLVTMLGNVPLNNNLAGVDAGEVEGNGEHSVSKTEAGMVWQHYQTVWLRWNSVRACACLFVSVVLLT